MPILILSRIPKRLFVVSVFLISFLILATKTKHSGIFADDAGFLRDFASFNFHDFWKLSITYVPGRNLHYPFQFFLYYLAGAGSNNFFWYHILQSVFFVLSGYLTFVLLNRLKVDFWLSLLGGCFVIFCPAYTEVLLWPLALPMHIFSSLAVLFLTSQVVSNLRDGPLTFTKSALLFLWFFIAVFTYDQAALATFFLIGFFLIFKSYQQINIRKWLFGSLSLLASWIIFITSIIFYVYLVLIARKSTSGPIVKEGMTQRILFHLEYIGQTILSSPNLFMNKFLPMKAMSSGLQSFVCLFFYAVIIVILVYLLKTVISLWKRTSDDAELRSFVLNRFFFLFLLTSASIFAYMPAWAWYVAPRHNYLPFIFIIMATILALDLIVHELVRNQAFKSNVVIAGSLLVALIGGALLTFNNINTWNSREGLRAGVYKDISSQLISVGKNPKTCLIFVSVDPAARTPFYSENVNAAYSIYTKQSFERFGSCRSKFDTFQSKVMRCVPVALEDKFTFVDFQRESLDSIDWGKPTFLLNC